MRHFSIKSTRIFKLSLMAMMICMVSVKPMNAQVFLSDEQFDSREGLPEGPGLILPGVLPEHNTTWDYTPLGSGVWVLCALGGAYLLGRKKKGDKQPLSK